MAAAEHLTGTLPLGGLLFLDRLQLRRIELVGIEVWIRILHRLRFHHDHSLLFADIHGFLLCNWFSR